MSSSRLAAVAHGHLYTNEQGRAVLKPFYDLLQSSPESLLAAPYFTRWAEIRECARKGRKIDLLIGLNTATSVEAVQKVVGEPNITVRYLTGRFHAKIYIFESDVLLGSANLTDSGLAGNREAVIRLYAATDHDRIVEVQALFEELWQSAEPPTTEVVRRFRLVMAGIPHLNDQDKRITDAVGKVEPANINVDSKKKTQRDKYAAARRKRVYEQYRPFFTEVAKLVEASGSRRPSLSGLSPENETNRFLNWVKLTYVKGEDWEEAELRPDDADRRENILRYASEWRTVDDDLVEQRYRDWLEVVEDAFSSPERIKNESKDDLTQGLMSIHAFSEQLRFVQNGALAAEFWKLNNNDDAKVRRSLTHLLYGSGDFIGRLHDVIYNPYYKLANFGLYCALELYGTVKPNEFPPVNGRIAKGLRFLGFKVQAD